jgi:REP element-mobilizing transposase RayT
MTRARKTVLSLNDTPYYHVVARCVRRAWLCGIDEYAGKDYSHRKTWIIERMSELSAVFAIDICAYAVMSNHYHLVVHADRKRAEAWSQREVIDRWCLLFSKPTLIDRWEQGDTSDAMREVAEDVIELWRRRLYDLSWYMRCLNEHLARRANIEDACNGRFWQGRFKSQALLDECGLLTAMVYVDLNPIRAGIASSPESSEFTSIYERICASQEHVGSSLSPRGAPPLMRLNPSSSETRSIPFALSDYIELVDWTGRMQRSDKRGSIASHLPPIMQRLNLDPEVWQNAMRPKGNVFGRAIGQLDRLRLHAATLDQSWIRGLNQARRLYG